MFNASSVLYARACSPSSPANYPSSPASSPASSPSSPPVLLLPVLCQFSASSAPVQASSVPVQASSTKTNILICFLGSRAIFLSQRPVTIGRPRIVVLPSMKFGKFRRTAPGNQYTCSTIGPKNANSSMGNFTDRTESQRALLNSTATPPKHPPSKYDPGISIPMHCHQHIYSLSLSFMLLPCILACTTNSCSWIAISRFKGSVCTAIMLWICLPYTLKAWDLGH